MKHDLRKKFERIRDSISPDEKARFDGIIAKHFYEWEPYKKARCIFCYVSFRSEVNTSGIIRKSLQTGKTIAVPKIDLRRKEMKSYIITDLAKDLVLGSYGILEPVESCIEADYSRIELIVAPGLAFTRRGERLGYGGGFYDRFIKNHNNITICAFVYDALVVEFLPVKEHDQAVDYLITESGVKKTAS